MEVIRRNGKTFGKVGMRRFTGGRYNLREVEPWHWQPQTLREAETFRMPREGGTKHIYAYSPCASAPVDTRPSFYERNRNPYLK